MALVFALGAFGYMRTARNEARSARDEAHRLAKALAHLDVLKEDLLALRKRQEKLTGRFFRDLRDEKAAAPPDDVDDGLASLLAFQAAPPAKP